ncbi:CDP-glucose 4,6-dehydratase [Candidatus Kaiserbacteria bacterium RIFCSPHIGHO2_02_FULL_50_50]|uniref:CDP-glucose 4,6-dehydratase n=1 Tax=Candidatus Kaiserbacteria bacterium RIFCSPHIGHO2_02_FULL_50_50 TaxID=1798492 RepID=A0A1F6DCN3_9BACT|nr:MAG: CDP-glucose 4,6-dehydratase [Candidatus Kaiserbacteria bacterium RIFCSPHIGHO2_02_FULL_50_50]
MQSYQFLQNAYQGKTVLVTGLTGFKGSWLCHTLLSMGAKVVGIGLLPRTYRDIFVVTGLRDMAEHHEFDIRDADHVRALVQQVSPDIVFHLAAQPLVRHSYAEPLLTVTTNVVGTTNVLEAIRQTPTVKAAVIITTDKVYENKEIDYGYREHDPLGGHDPYSGSKAAADIVAQSYIRSFFNPSRYGERHNTLVAIARAGNVIGGGDWSPDRIIPDIMRSVLDGGSDVLIRSPFAVRPWEHVLEPVSGYLALGARLLQGEAEFSSAWNFGPDHDLWLPVGEMVQRVLTLFERKTAWRGVMQCDTHHDAEKHEAVLLTLDVTKANRRLGWRSQWDIDTTLTQTVMWYAQVAEDPSLARDVTLQQINLYFNNP